VRAESLLLPLGTQDLGLMGAQNDHAKRMYRRPVVPESSVVNIFG
jgi:hypothetical protein